MSKLIRKRWRLKISRSFSCRLFDLLKMLPLGPATFIATIQAENMLGVFRQFLY